MRKLSLVNETLRPETETRLRRLTFSPRRDRDVETETTSLRLPIRLLTASGRIVIFPVELWRVTFELPDAWSRQAGGSKDSG